MKNLFTFLVLIGLVTFTYGQTFISEDFSGNQMPPDGWTIDSLSSQWSINNGSLAGGSTPEGKFTTINGEHFTRLISPEIDLTGLSTVMIQFNQFFDWFANPAPITGLATRSGAGDWNIVWFITQTEDTGPETVYVEISNDDVGTSNFQFCLYLDGDLYNLNYWYIDDILLFNPLNLDAEMLSISTPCYIGGPIEIAGTIRSYGTTQITSVEISWETNGNINSTVISGLSLNFGDTYDFMCDDLFNFPIGSYELNVSIDAVNGLTDDNPENNQLTRSICVISNTVNKKPCFEEFTSSTCLTCAGFNIQFTPWIEDHFDDITLIKYQMNWPPPGDIYYTEEGGLRRAMYDVSGIPALFGNGSFIGVPGMVPTITEVIQAYNTALIQPGIMNIVASHILNGSLMEIETTVLPYAFTSDAKIHIIVFEHLTTGNVGSNGETEFMHVMMKMVPDANGTTTDLSDRVPFTINETVDLSDSNIEGWDDLGVLVFVQDNITNVIYQSAYSIENENYAIDATLSSILMDGELIPDFDPDIYEYIIKLPQGTVEVPITEATSSDPNATIIIVPTYEIPGMTTVDVFAEDLSTHLAYTVQFEYETGTDKISLHSIQIYPNPTSGKIYLQGINSGIIEVYSNMGTLVATFTDLSNNQIELSSLEDGIYFLKIVIDKEKVLTKKVCLLK